MLAVLEKREMTERERTAGFKEREKCRQDRSIKSCYCSSCRRSMCHPGTPYKMLDVEHAEGSLASQACIAEMLA